MRMSRVRTWAIVLLIVLAIGMTPWPRTAMAITPQSQTVHIIDTHDDGFVTEVGIGIDSSLVHVLDPGMDLRSFLVFRDLKINYWEPLKNATLKLRTSNTMAFDADSSVTIYGISLDNLQLEGWLGPAFIMSAPLTDAHVNVNTSQFYGQTWKDVNVTEIIEELIRHYNWDGDGADGTETGDAIGFIILGAEGHDTRYFYDYLGNPDLSADLVLHWNHEPPPPSGYEDEAIFNETYRGYHIWNLVPVGWLNYSSFTLTNPDGNIQNLNDTYFEYDTYYEDDDDYLRKDFDQATGTVIRKFGITYLEFRDTSASEAGAIVTHWGISNSTVTPWGPPYWTEGYSLVTAQPTSSQERLEMVTWVGGAHETHLVTHQYWPDSALPITIWVDINLNLDTGGYSIVLYNDIEMTDVNISKTGTFSPQPDASKFGTEFAMAGTVDSSAFRDWESGLRHSMLDLPGTWAVTDENGTTIVDDCTSYECALRTIDDELGADPQDPDPPSDEWPDTGPFTRFNTRMGIFIVGFFMVWGTVWFFAWKRPDGYYLLVGALFIIMGIGLIIHSVSI